MKKVIETIGIILAFVIGLIIYLVTIMIGAVNNDNF